MLFLATLGGCLNGAEVPYLGRWNGQFTVDTVDPKLLVRDSKRNSLHGFLQLYRTENRCTLHLDGEQEGVDVNGTWDLKPHQIILTFTGDGRIKPNRVNGKNTSNLTIDDAGGIDLRDPNKAFIPPADLKAAYSIPLALKLDPGKRQLTSPLIQIGPLTGHYEFTKDSLGR